MTTNYNLYYGWLNNTNISTLQIIISTRDFNQQQMNTTINNSRNLRVKLFLTNSISWLKNLKIWMMKTPSLVNGELLPWHWTGVFCLYSFSFIFSLYLCVSYDHQVMCRNISPNDYSSGQTTYPVKISGYYDYFYGRIAVIATKHLFQR